MFSIHFSAFCCKLKLSPSVYIYLSTSRGAFSTVELGRPKINKADLRDFSLQNSKFTVPLQNQQKPARHPQNFDSRQHQRSILGDLSFKNEKLSAELTASLRFAICQSHLPKILRLPRKECCWIMQSAARFTQSHL